MSTFPTVDKNTVLARARAAIENREKYIESLFDAAGAAAAAREKVTEAARAADRADAEHAAAYQDALDAGWTSAELRETGLTLPAVVEKKSSKSTRRRAAARPARRRVGAEHSPGIEQRDAAPAGEGTAASDPQSAPAPAPAH